MEFILCTVGKQLKLISVGTFLNPNGNGACHKMVLNDTNKLHEVFETVHLVDIEKRINKWYRTNDRRRSIIMC